MLILSPFEPIYQDVYERLLAAMPKGDFLLRTPITLPLRESGVHTFQVKTDLGAEVTMEVNGAVITTFIATSVLTSIDLTFTRPGRNFVRARTRSESAPLAVAAVRYGVFLQGWASDWFFNIEAQLAEQRNQLNSKFGLRAIENQLTFQSLLPGTRMLRTLAGKLAVKSVLNEGGSTEGVNTFAAAVSGTNPVVIQQVAAPVLEPSVFPLVNNAQDWGGFEMHLWVTNLCAAAYSTYIHLMDHLPTRIANLEEVTDDRVQVLRNGITRNVHRFDFDEEGCSLLDILTGLLDCLSGIKVWMRMNWHSRFFFPGYTYALDEVVDLPIACRPFDSVRLGPDGLPRPPTLPFLLDSTPDPRTAITDPHTDVPRLDSCEDSDPLDASDAWFGLPLTDRLDGGRTLDTIHSGVYPTCEDTPVTFDRAQASGAISALVDAFIPYPSSPLGF